MTSQRAEAYGRVMKVLADLAASKLHAPEQQIVREAADALVFCDDLAVDVDAAEALLAAADLCEHLVVSERLTPESAERLLSELEACGPYAVPDSLPVPEVVA